MLPEIAHFFNVSVDDLLGINQVKKEDEIVKQINKYDNLTDPKLKDELIRDLKERFPTDFRVLLRYMNYLIHYTYNPADNHSKILSNVTSIYNNIQQNCHIDEIRISAKRYIIEFYHALSKKPESGITFEDYAEIIKEMPKVRDSKELFCFFYPENHPERNRKIQDSIESFVTLLDSLISHYYFFDESFSIDYKIEILEKEMDFINFIYEDGNYGKNWRMMMQNYGHLAVRYSLKGDYEKALDNLRKSAELAKKFDDLDRVSIMNSKLFEGKEFDKHTLGITFVAKSRMKKLITEKFPLPDELKATDEFQKIINELE